MAWSIRYVDEEGLVETRYYGRVDAKDLKEAFKASQESLSAHKCIRLLADCTGITDPPSLIDIFELVFLIIKAGGTPSDFREAVILPESELSRKGVQFFETVCRNRGLNVHVFGSREEGLLWMNHKP